MRPLTPPSVSAPFYRYLKLQLHRPEKSWNRHWSHWAGIELGTSSTEGSALTNCATQRLQVHTPHNGKMENSLIIGNLKFQWSGKEIAHWVLRQLNTFQQILTSSSKHQEEISWSLLSRPLWDVYYWQRISSRKLQMKRKKRSLYQIFPLDERHNVWIAFLCAIKTT